jgi:hypothetical protein
MTIKKSSDGKMFRKPFMSAPFDIRPDRCGVVFPCHFFQYSDFDMGGAAVNDSVLLSGNGFTLRFNHAGALISAILAVCAVSRRRRGI